MALIYGSAVDHDAEGAEQANFQRGRVRSFRVDTHEDNFSLTVSDLRTNNNQLLDRLFEISARWKQPGFVRAPLVCRGVPPLAPLVRLRDFCPWTFVHCAMGAHGGTPLQGGSAPLLISLRQRGARASLLQRIAKAVGGVHESAYDAGLGG